MRSRSRLNIRPQASFAAIWNEMREDHTPKEGDPSRYFVVNDQLLLQRCSLVAFLLIDNGHQNTTRHFCRAQNFSTPGAISNIVPLHVCPSWSFTL
jgi:hypothetical protein